MTSTPTTVADELQTPNDFGDSPLALLGKEPLESALIEAQTLAYGLTSERFSTSLFTAADGVGGLLGFRRAASSQSSMVGTEFCADKAVTKALLQAHGVPTAAGARMPKGGLRSALRFVEKHGWPVVVKPRKGSGGRGVTADIQDEDQLASAIEAADATGGFLIEKHVSGEDFRFLVSGDTVIGVWRRDAANVVGDGNRTLSELIDQKNEVRARNPHLASRPIGKDDLVRMHLERDGRDLDFVPTDGQKIYLRSAANLSSGGDNIEITDETHPSLKEIAVRAKQLLPTMELVGIDLLLDDHRLPAHEQSANICEINSTPGLSAHDFPMYGPVRPVARLYVEKVAQLEGLRLGRWNSEVRDFALEAHGEFTDTGFLPRVDLEARDAGLEVLETTTGDGVATARVRGTAVAAATFDTLMLAPRAKFVRVQSTKLTPMDER